MTIYKGNELEFHFGIAPCCLSDIDIDLIRDIHLDIFTAPGSTAIRKDISDISISGEIGTVHLEWEELDILEDGVIRFKLDYFYEGEEISFERSTNLYLKTPINYQPTTFITEDELEQAVAEAISGISATTVEEVEEMIAEAISGISGDCNVVIYDFNEIESATTEQRVAIYNEMQSIIASGKTIIVRKPYDDSNFGYDYQLTSFRDNDYKIIHFDCIVQGTNAVIYEIYFYWDGRWVVNSRNLYTLPTANDTRLGGIKVGSGLTVDEDGVLSTISNDGQAYYITRQNRETIGADIWARYSANTAEEVAAMPITVRSYYGTNLVCVRKENDSLIFAGTVEASNGSYWTTYYCEYGMKATGTTFGEHSWTTPIVLRVDTTTHNLSYIESPLGWAGIGRALYNGASVNIMTNDQKSSSLYVMADDITNSNDYNLITFTLYAEFIHLNTKIEAAWRMERQQVSCTKWVETPLV